VKSNPPFHVTPLLWTVLSLTGWNFFRVWTAIAWSGILAEFTPQPGPLYIGISGAIWSVVGLVLVWAILWAKKWTPRLLVGSAAAYTLWYWIDRLVLQTQRDNWPFTLAVNLLILILVVITTQSNYFQREAYERKSENQEVT
jgi:hypothetical protein